MKRWMWEMVEMSAKAYAVGMIWHHDFHENNITWNERTGECLMWRKDQLLADPFIYVGG